MDPYFRRAVLAGQVRRARGALSEASAQLFDVGLDDVLFQLTNVECQLEEIHLQLMQPMRKRRPSPPPPGGGCASDDVPF